MIESVLYCLLMSFELHENLQKQKCYSHFKNLDSLNSQRFTEIYCQILGFSVSLKTQ
jgi:hypothetical protein